MGDNLDLNVTMANDTECMLDIIMAAKEERWRREFLNSSVAIFRDEERRINSIIEVIMYFTTALCILGVVGNILNILVLSQKGLLVTMERMERSAHFGLLALALSDLLFCALAVPRFWVPIANRYHSQSFSLYYATYSDGFINTFLLSSTWLTVTIATSRYLAICFPLRARQVIGMTFAKASIILVFIVCILFNIPRYFTWQIEPVDGVYCHTIYLKNPGPLLTNTTVGNTYRWTYFVAGILIPLLMLAYCNINLVRTLQHSARTQVTLRATRTNAVHTTNRITLIFIIIIVLYLFMVMPGELLLFAREFASQSSHGHFRFNLALAVTNTCQAFNFAFNFVLYMIVNTHFRGQLCMLIHCSYLRGQRIDRRNVTVHSFTRHGELSHTEHMTVNTTVAPNGGPLRNSTAYV